MKINSREKNIILLLAVCLVLISCGSLLHKEYIIRFYNGPHLPKEQVATLRRFSIDRCYPVFEINGKKISKDLELLPGKYTFCIGYISYKGSRSSSCVNKEIIAKPGHTYVVYPVLYTHNEIWHPEVWDITDIIQNSEKNNYASGEILSDEEKDRQEWLHAYRIWRKLTESKEKVTDIINGIKGNKVEVEYIFNRFRPFVIGKGIDNDEYHLEISPINGEVINVIGKKVVIGKEGWLSNAYPGYQPLGSDLVYVVRRKVTTWSDALKKYTRTDYINDVYKELSDGNYKLLKEGYRYGAFDHKNLIKNIEVTKLLIFESGLPFTQANQRDYRSMFNKSEVRNIVWELHLKYPLPGKKINYKITAIWWKPDGSVLKCKNTESYIDADWTSSWVVDGLGDEDWEIGTYTVELLKYSLLSRPFFEKFKS